MGWSAGQLDCPFTSRAAIAFGLGEEFAERVIATARYGTVIYAAVRAKRSFHVFGLVLLAERRDGVLYTKPITEDMGPVEDCCPARILDLLTESSNEHARNWRQRCRRRIDRGRPKPGQAVAFQRPIKFTDGADIGFSPSSVALASARARECSIASRPGRGSTTSCAKPQRS